MFGRNDRQGGFQPQINLSPMPQLALRIKHYRDAWFSSAFKEVYSANRNCENRELARLVLSAFIFKIITHVEKNFYAKDFFSDAGVIRIFNSSLRLQLVLMIMQRKLAEKPEQDILGQAQTLLKHEDLIKEQARSLMPGGRPHGVSLHNDAEIPYILAAIIKELNMGGHDPRDFFQDERVKKLLRAVPSYKTILDNFDCLDHEEKAAAHSPIVGQGMYAQTKVTDGLGQKLKEVMRTYGPKRFLIKLDNYGAINEDFLSAELLQSVCDTFGDDILVRLTNEMQS